MKYSKDSYSKDYSGNLLQVLLLVILQGLSFIVALKFGSVLSSMAISVLVAIPSAVNFIVLLKLVSKVSRLEKRIFPE